MSMHDFSKQSPDIQISDLRRADPVVFLDTASAEGSGAKMLLFEKPILEIVAYDPADVSLAFDQIEELSEQFWLAGYVDYTAFHSVLGVSLRRQRASEALPLMWFGVYEKPREAEAVNTSGCFAPKMNVSASLDYCEYERQLAAIKQYIKEGETYQVNYTFDVLVAANASAEYLYGYLREFQKTPYCAFLSAGGREILSFSPELFFQRQQERMSVQPMKGTAARGESEDSDAQMRCQLAGDEKNRAENLMIVDLLRSDLGRIAQTGSVVVESLFDVETHSTLHQMTSRIHAQLKADTTYFQIFEALFPSGSVTGAPKLRTMQIIDQLETGTRGIYCGAIGYIAPQGRAMFSVPIRTLQRPVGSQDWQYRVGSGIVWDSKTQAEWDEVQLKTKFLTQKSPSDFELIETMLWQNGNVVFSDEHVRRLRVSAEYFGFQPCEKVKEQLSGFLETLPKNPQRIRMRLASDGSLRFEHISVEVPDPSKDVAIRVSAVRLDPQNIFLRHKTTYRPWYQPTMEKISRGEVFDEIFFNADGFLCEGAISNVFVEIKGTLYTPPLSCGLLPGILRQNLLQERRCVERKITVEDFLSAEGVYVGNSVRGLLTAVVQR